MEIRDTSHSGGFVNKGGVGTRFPNHPIEMWSWKQKKSIRIIKFFVYKVYVLCLTGTKFIFLLVLNPLGLCLQPMVCNKTELDFHTIFPFQSECEFFGVLAFKETAM